MFESILFYAFSIVLIGAAAGVVFARNPVHAVMFLVLTFFQSACLWLLAEAEYYMQIANAQLQLAGNPYLAAQALRMADERVARLADPALTDVRRAVADELAALDGMEKPDIEGVTLTLASLARVVATLPLREMTSASSDEGTQIDPEAGGLDRAWASVRSAIACWASANWFSAVASWRCQRPPAFILISLSAKAASASLTD